jgi:hypothetical protein
MSWGTVRRNHEFLYKRWVWGFTAFDFPFGFFNRRSFSFCIGALRTKSTDGILANQVWNPPTAAELKALGLQDKVGYLSIIKGNICILPTSTDE